MARLARNLKKKPALLKKSRVQTSKTSDRASRAEWRDLARQLQEERARKTELENRVSQLEAEDVGRIIYQNQWNQVGCSQTVAFPSPVSCTCRSIEDVDGCDMPGIFARDPFEETGLFSQSILIKGGGYTLIGFVSTDDEKQYLLTQAISDWTKFPLMKSVGFEDAYKTYTFNVDMVNRTAELYSGSQEPVETATASSELEPIVKWENLPEKLWLGVAFKRNTEREAVLLPGTHWKVSRMG